jgi:hypothetical protein
MPTECSAERFDFGIVEGRAVEAAFDGGSVTSDAGALLLGASRGCGQSASRSRTSRTGSRSARAFPGIHVLLDKAALGGVDSKGAVGRYRGNLVDFDPYGVLITMRVELVWARRLT